MLLIYLLIIIQILLENFPVSSSGHLLLLIAFFENNFFYFFNNEFNFKCLEYLLHLPTIIVLVFFLLKNSFFERLKALSQNKYLDILIFIFIVDFVTVLFYYFFPIKNHICLCVGFLITALLLLSLKFVKTKNYKSTLGKKDAFLIGIAQGVSLAPGISRLALTFTVNRWLGFKSEDSLMLSFLFALPLLCAGVFKGVFGLFCSNFYCRFWNLWNIKIALLVLALMIVSYFFLLILKILVEKNKLWFFSVYMLIPTLLCFLLKLNSSLDLKRKYDEKIIKISGKN